MLTKNERIEKLNNAGVDTSKYFTVSLPNGIKPGSTISLVINEDGQPVFVDNSKDDAIANQIIEDGYVRNTKLHRRFVCAQMFHALNYVSFDGKETGYNAYLKNMYAYQYTLNMMFEEVRVLGKLETRDKESFEERSHFFTKNVVAEVLYDYLDKLKKYVDTLPIKHCKGVPYVRVKGTNIFVDDLEKKLYGPIRRQINKIASATTSYDQMYNLMTWLTRDMIKLPYNTPKSKAWIDAYKGEGAYYTLKNLVMFHDCAIEYKYETYRRDAAMQQLKYKLEDYKGEGWRMFDFMKKLIEDNHFDFNKRMGEIYSK